MLNPVTQYLNSVRDALSTDYAIFSPEVRSQAARDLRNLPVIDIGMVDLDPVNMGRGVDMEFKLAVTLTWQPNAADTDSLPLFVDVFCAIVAKVAHTRFEGSSHAGSQKLEVEDNSETDYYSLTIHKPDTLKITQQVEFREQIVGVGEGSYLSPMIEIPDDAEVNVTVEYE